MTNKEQTITLWHDASVEPDEYTQILVCIHNCYYVGIYHKKDKRFYLLSNRPNFYLCEIEKWAYIHDLLNLATNNIAANGMKEVTASADLEEECMNYMESHNGVWVDTDYILFAKHFASWQREKMVKDAVLSMVITRDIVPFIGGLDLGEFLKQNFSGGDLVRVIVIKED